MQFSAPFDHTRPCSSLILIVFVVAALTPGPARAQELDKALEERFLREAPERWREYLSRATLLQGRIIDQCLESPDGQDVQEFEYKTNGKCRLLAHGSKVRRERDQDKRDKDVFAINPRYGFRLRRTTADGPWTVLQILDFSNESLPDDWRFMFAAFEREANDLVELDAQPLTEIVQSQSFRITHCQGIQRDGEDLVEVTFTYDREPGTSGRPGAYRATGVFDPKRFWCRRSGECEVRFKNDDRFKSGKVKSPVLVLGETSGSLPFLKEAMVEREFVEDQNRKVRIVYRVQHDLEIPRRLPADEEFTLAAFGFPEPPGLEWKRPTRWYVWVGLAGIVCLAGA